MIPKLILKKKKKEFKTEFGININKSLQGNRSTIMDNIMKHEKELDITNNRWNEELWVTYKKVFEVKMTDFVTKIEGRLPVWQSNFNDALSKAKNDKDGWSKL